eukprot:360719-Chlamydomonas_euryale.AAC.8
MLHSAWDCTVQVMVVGGGARCGGTYAVLAAPVPIASRALSSDYAGSEAAPAGTIPSDVYCSHQAEHMQRVMSPTSPDRRHCPQSVAHKYGTHRG